MAYDKAIDSAKLEQDLTAVADAIRASTGTEEPLEFPRGYVDGIGAISENSVASVINGEMAELVNTKITKDIPGSFQLGNANLRRVYLPNTKAIQTSAFERCSSLEEISLESVKTLYTKSFADCSKVESLYLPAFSAFDSYAYGTFVRCTSLKRVYFPVLTGLKDRTFKDCTRLETLILGTSTLCVLASSTAFDGCTLIKNGTGYIYVPAVLVGEYKAATNWSAYADQIRAIEDYPEVLEGWE